MAWTAALVKLASVQLTRSPLAGGFGIGGTQELRMPDVHGIETLVPPAAPQQPGRPPPRYRNDGAQQEAPPEDTHPRDRPPLFDGGTSSDAWGVPAGSATDLFDKLYTDREQELEELRKGVERLGLTDEGENLDAKVARLGSHDHSPRAATEDKKPAVNCNFPNDPRLLLVEYDQCGPLTPTPMLLFGTIWVWVTAIAPGFLGLVRGYRSGGCSRITQQFREVMQVLTHWGVSPGSSIKDVRVRLRQQEMGAAAGITERRLNIGQGNTVLDLRREIARITGTEQDLWQVWRLNPAAPPHLLHDSAQLDSLSETRRAILVFDLDEAERRRSGGWTGRVGAVGRGAEHSVRAASSAASSSGGRSSSDQDRGAEEAGNRAEQGLVQAGQMSHIPVLAGHHANNSEADLPFQPEQRNYNNLPSSSSSSSLASQGQSQVDNLFDQHSLHHGSLNNASHLHQPSVPADFAATRPAPAASAGSPLGLSAGAASAAGGPGGVSLLTTAQREQLSQFG
eukprot:GSA120T00020286001.1